MGLFSSKYVTTVSSVLYNLAGDEIDRLNYLKTAVVGAVLSGQDTGVDVVKAHLNGPGIRQRQFQKWAKNNFTLGTPTASIRGLYPLDADLVAAQIPENTGFTIEIQSTYIEAANSFYYAEQYILDNHQELVDTDWTSEYNIGSSDITITYEDTTTETIPLVGYNNLQDFVIAYYHEVNDTTDVVGPLKLFIYVLGGTNIALNEMEDTSASVEEFFPFIPLRLDNLPINDPSFVADGTYAECKKAFKRGTDNNIDTVLDSIEDNPQVGDIDFAFLSWGVPLNVVDNSARKYLYGYFKSLIAQQVTSASQYEGFFAAQVDEAAAQATYDAWVVAQLDPMDPLYGTARPPQPTSTPPTLSTLDIVSNDSRVSQYHINLTWMNVAEDQFTGLGKVGAKSGELWLEAAPDDVWVEFLGTKEVYNGPEADFTYESVTQTNTFEVFYIYWQLTDNTYQRLTVRGAVHQNFAYNQLSITTYSTLALADTDESSFLVPMHYPTVREMNLIDSTQMVTANTFIVFNTYQTTKVRWYERGIFKLILLIVAVVVSVLFAPAGFATAGGILGSNAVVGAAIGLTGTAALIAGAVANALAGMIIANIVSAASVKLFGEKIGGIIGAIATFLVMNFAAAASSGAGSFDFSTIFRAENIMKLMDVAGDAYASFAQATVKDIIQEIDTLGKQYEIDSTEIERLTNELGISGGIIDPLMFTEAYNNFNFTEESPAEFINRTTMVGSDIVDISLSMVYDYAQNNTQLPSKLNKG